MEPTMIMRYICVTSWRNCHEVVREIAEHVYIPPIQENIRIFWSRCQKNTFITKISEMNNIFYRWNLWIIYTMSSEDWGIPL